MWIRSSLVRSFIAHSAAAVVLVAVTGCQDKPAPKPESAGADAGLRHASGVDKNIEEAITAVAGGAGTPANGPPESGVFGPGAADREIRQGDPPKLVIGSKGTAPLVEFGAPSAASGKKVPGKVEVAIQMGPRSAMPTVDFLVSLEGEGTNTDSQNPLEVDAKVVAARPAAEQPGQLPPGTDAQIAKAKGSRVRFETSKSGGGRITAIEPVKDLDPTFVEILKSAAGILGFGLLPYPREPVGAGAFWMVTSREPFAGLDVVAYRMFKLDKVENGRATITISAKRVAAGGQIAFGLPPHHLDGFNGNTTGQMDVTVADPSAVQGEAIDMLLANLTPSQATDQAPAGQKLSIQLQIHSKFVLGK